MRPSTDFLPMRVSGDTSNNKAFLALKRNAVWLPFLRNLLLQFMDLAEAPSAQATASEPPAPTSSRPQIDDYDSNSITFRRSRDEDPQNLPANKDKRKINRSK